MRGYNGRETFYIYGPGDSMVEGEEGAETSSPRERLADGARSISRPPASKYGVSRAVYEACSINYGDSGPDGDSDRVAFPAIIAILAVIMPIRPILTTLLELLLGLGYVFPENKTREKMGYR